GSLLAHCVRGLDPESDFQADLEVLDVAVEELPTNFGDLEPVEVPGGFSSTCDRVGDRGFEAVMGCSDELDHPVAVLRHGVPLSVVTLSLLRSAKSSNRTRAPARILLSLRRYPRTDRSTTNLGLLATGSQFPNSRLSLA